MTSIIDQIESERSKQKGFDDFDKSNTRNDWVAYITSYAGDAAEKVKKKELNSQAEEDHRFRDNMIKVAALAVAAIESHDNGSC